MLYVRRLSTFSFENKEKPVMACPPGTSWTDCVDAPCTLDPQNAQKAICSCPIKKSAAMITFGGNCDAKTCNTGFWSGATNKTSATLQNAFKKDLGELPKIKECAKTEGNK